MFISPSTMTLCGKVEARSSKHYNDDVITNNADVLILIHVSLYVIICVIICHYMCHYMSLHAINTSNMLTSSLTQLSLTHLCTHSRRVTHRCVAKELHVLEITYIHYFLVILKRMLQNCQKKKCFSVTVTHLDNVHIFNHTILCCSL